MSKEEGPPRTDHRVELNPGKLLRGYIHEFMLKIGLIDTAEVFMLEAQLEDSEILDTTTDGDGFLFEWFSRNCTTNNQGIGSNFSKYLDPIPKHGLIHLRLTECILEYLQEIGLICTMMVLRAEIASGIEITTTSVEPGFLNGKWLKLWPAYFCEVFRRSEDLAPTNETVDHFKALVELNQGLASTRNEMDWNDYFMAPNSLFGRLKTPGSFLDDEQEVDAVRPDQLLEDFHMTELDSTPSQQELFDMLPQQLRERSDFLELIAEGFYSMDPEQRLKSECPPIQPPPLRALPVQQHIEEVLEMQIPLGQKVSRPLTDKQRAIRKLMYKAFQLLTEKQQYLFETLPRQLKTNIWLLLLEIYQFLCLSPVERKLFLLLRDLKQQEFFHSLSLRQQQLVLRCIGALDLTSQGTENPQPGFDVHSSENFHQNLSQMHQFLLTPEQANLFRWTPDQLRRFSLLPEPFQQVFALPALQAEQYLMMNQEKQENFELYDYVKKTMGYNFSIKQRRNAIQSLTPEEREDFQLMPPWQQSEIVGNFVMKQTFELLTDNQLRLWKLLPPRLKRPIWFLMLVASQYYYMSTKGQNAIRRWLLSLQS